jgi:gliding motility-associated-like protein
MTLRIYDRWGEKVFESHDPDNGWDGTYKGKPLDPDVYVYYLDITSVGQQQHFEKGNITFIR